MNYHILSGNKESPTSLQVLGWPTIPNSRFLIGEEDCLYLNVFTPNLPKRNNGIGLPVIVFIHGGAFCVGSSDSRLHGPDFFLDHPVVLVTINYRYFLQIFFERRLGFSLGAPINEYLSSVFALL